MATTDNDGRGARTRAQSPADRAVISPAPGGALAIGGITALAHSVHLVAQATDGLRHKLGEQLNLNPIDVTALINVYNSPDIRPTDLGRSLHMGSAGLTALADRLIKAGFLQRRPDPADRRGYRLRLSPSGLRAAGQIFDTVAAALKANLDPAADPSVMTAALIEVARVIELTEPSAAD